MKAIGLLSGGLDSTLAVKIIMDMGVDVVAVKYTSPFCQCDSGGCCHAAEVARQMGVPLKTVPKGDDYLAVVRHPRHGYGTAMNPCIDCRIFMFSKAKALLDELGAAFLFTGEVLGQRPMSQHRRAIDLIERESGLEGQVVRPLSAQHFEPTVAEKNGWIDRAKLLDLHGRGRRPQLALASAFGIEGFGCPAGGCLLTDKHFAAKLRDLFAHQEHAAMRDIHLLKIGRHFRAGGRKLVCARDEAECKALRLRAGENDAVVEPVDCAGPVVLLQGGLADEAAVRLAAEVAAAYADGTSPEVLVHVSSGAAEREFRAPRVARDALRATRL
jgi:tRNA U34 2-thiouridine synthase MnmA/TrmU